MTQESSGQIRNLTRLGNGRQEPSLGFYGEQLVSQLLPKYAHLSAYGKLFAFDMSAGTAKAPVVAMPTTSPEWGFYNASAKLHLIPIMVAISLASGTAGLGLSIVMATAKGPQTAVSANYTGAIVSALDGSNDAPEAYITNNPTLIGGTPAWVPMALTPVNSIANDGVGEGLVAWPEGLFTAKPNGGMVAVEVVGEVGTTALYDIAVICAQLEL